MTMQLFIRVSTSTTKDVEIIEKGVTVFRGNVTDNSTEQAWHDFVKGVYQAGVNVGVSVSAQQVKESLDRGYPDD